MRSKTVNDYGLDQGRSLLLKALLVVINLWVASSVAAKSTPEATPTHQLTIGADLRYLRPYNCTEEGTRSCIFPDIVKSLLAPLNMGFEFLPAPEPRKYLDMAQGKLDAAIIFTSDLLEQDQYPDTVHICPTPLVSSALSIFTRSDSNINIQTLADMKRYHPVALRLPEFQRDMIGTRQFKKVTRTKSLQQMSRIVMAGRGDYFIFEKFSTFHMLAENNLDNKIIWYKDLTRLDYHMALSKKRMRDVRDMKKICDHIDQQVKDGKIFAIVESYTNPLAIN